MSFAARPIGLHVTGEFVFNDVIDSDVTNYNLRARAVAAGWDQVVPLIATTIINSGIVLSADSISQYGFDTGTTFPAGTTLALVNNGFVIGMGGEGGAGSVGSVGGPALRAQAALSVTNNGTIGGGGGGGGGGVSSGYDYIYGGGGRSGRTNSSASGAAQAGTFTKGGNSSSGATGGTTAAGASDFSGAGGGGAGGGGGWGADGGTGYDYTAKTTRSGGAGGAAVVGNANITWINTGTRYGAIT